ncbi:hypothetical protein [Kitasatospora terrestris]|uniref:Uncharacterized protein n=1 Tax=Kitasatospora terrestris TaxID=258051 RepID=A0ABP9EET7_9ACTN
MTRRWIAGRIVGGAAAVPLALLAVGWWHTRPGGRVLVADTLYRPLVAVALALVAIGRCVAEEHRGRRAGMLVLTWVAGAVLGFGAWAAGVFGEPTQVTRTAAPGGVGRTLVVVHHGNLGAETEAQSWEVLVESGSGWSARRWTVFEMPEQFPGDGAFTSARWTGPDEITVTTDRGVRVFGVDPRSGRPAPTGSVAE